MFDSKVLIPLSATVVLVLSNAVVHAGTDAKAAPAKKPTEPPFGCFFSQMDDHLAESSAYAKPVWNLHDTLKLPDWLSVSLEQRVRYESLSRQFHADAHGGDQQIGLVSCLSLEAHYEALRIGTEWLDARQFGADSGSLLNNTHVNTLDLLQGYVAWAERNVFDSGIGAEVILGRQTLNFGSRRLVARNVFRNTINAFTGVRLRLQDPGHWQFNGFVTLPVGRYPNNPNALLANRHAWDEELYNTWFSGGFFEWYGLPWQTNAELYLYHLSEGDQANNATRKRRLFTPGVRWYRKPAKGELDFQLETVGQFGTVRATIAASDSDDLTHQAWFQHVTLGYTVTWPWTPRLALYYDYASGDSNPNDHRSERFDSLFGARRFEYGPTGIYGVVGRSNLSSPGYRLSVAPHSDVQAFFTHRFFWLAENRDAWTTTGLRDRTGMAGNDIGHQLEIAVRWNINSSLNLETGWTHLFKERFALQAPRAPEGDEVDYFYVQSLLRF